MTLIVGPTKGLSTVVVPRTPAVVRAVVPGPVGGEGPEGPEGPKGIPGDYGWTRYGEGAGIAPTEMLAGIETPFVVQTPVIMQDHLRAPFEGFQFLDATGRLWARKEADAYLVRIRFMATADVAGGSIEGNVYITNNDSGIAGSNSVREKPLRAQAGDDNLIDWLFPLFPGSGFVSNGARIMLKSTVPVRMKNETLWVLPSSAAP